MNNASQSPLKEILSSGNANGRKLCSLCGLCMFNEWSAERDPPYPELFICETALS